MKGQFISAKGQAGRAQQIMKASECGNVWHKLPGRQGTLDKKRSLEGEEAFLENRYWLGNRVYLEEED